MPEAGIAGTLGGSKPDHAGSQIAGSLDYIDANIGFLDGVNDLIKAMFYMLMQQLSAFCRIVFSQCFEDCIVFPLGEIPATLHIDPPHIPDARIYVLKSS